MTSTAGLRDSLSCLSFGVGCRSRVGSAIAGLLSGLLLAGCASEGETDSPVAGRFTWISYVSGDDIRTACAAGSPERYRFVFNARFDEQRRTYEIQGDTTGTGFLTARARGRATISEIRSTDFLAPWRWQTAEALLSAQDMDQLRGALAEAGLPGRPEVGLQLNSKAFYWAVVGCVDGNFVFGGWQHPSDTFDALRFPEMLFARDQTGMAVNEPRRLTPIELGRVSQQGNRRRSGDLPRFLITVREDGLRGGGLGLRNPL